VHTVSYAYLNDVCHYAMEIVRLLVHNFFLGKHKLPPRPLLRPDSCTSTQLNSTENYGCRCLTPPSPHHYGLTIINEHYHFMTSSDRFLVPVRSAVKSNLTAWCCQNLSNRALNALAVISKLFQILIVHAEKKCFRKS